MNSSLLTGFCNTVQPRPILWRLLRNNICPLLLSEQSAGCDIYSGVFMASNVTSNTSMLPGSLIGMMHWEEDVVVITNKE